MLSLWRVRALLPVLVLECMLLLACDAYPNLESNPDREDGVLRNRATLHQGARETYVEGRIGLTDFKSTAPALREYQESSRWTISEDGKPISAAVTFAVLIDRGGVPMLRFRYRRPANTSRGATFSFDGEVIAQIEYSEGTEFVAQLDVHPSSLLGPEKTEWTSEYIQSQLQCLAQIYADECRVWVDVHPVTKPLVPQTLDGFLALPVTVLRGIWN